VVWRPAERRGSRNRRQCRECRGSGRLCSVDTTSLAELREARLKTPECLLYGATQDSQKLFFVDMTSYVFLTDATE
jgi:hypothetical protein